jgi:hypothetical protein
MKWKLQEKRKKKNKISKMAFKRKKRLRRFSFQKIRMSSLNFYFVYLTFHQKAIIIIIIIIGLFLTYLDDPILIQVGYQSLKYYKFILNF